MKIEIDLYITKTLLTQYHLTSEFDGRELNRHQCPDPRPEHRQGHKDMNMDRCPASSAWASTIFDT